MMRASFNAEIFHLWNGDDSELEDFWAMVSFPARYSNGGFLRPIGLTNSIVLSFPRDNNSLLGLLIR